MRVPSRSRNTAGRPLLTIASLQLVLRRPHPTRACRSLQRSPSGLEGRAHPASARSVRSMDLVGPSRLEQPPRRSGPPRDDEDQRLRQLGLAMLDAFYRLAYNGAYRLMRVYWAVRRPDTHGALVAV